MAAAASVAAGWAEEEFTDGELEVAAILCDLPAIVRARRRRRPEIPTWGRRRPRTLPVEKPAAVAVADRGEGAASPDTPLAFPEESGGDDGEAAAAKQKKSRTHEQWVQEQRGVVANLSQENARLLKQIEEYRARLQSSRSTNDSLKQMQMQSKLKQQRQQEEEQRKLQAEATAVDRPALGLDLNEPAEEDEEAKAQAAAAAAEWYYRGQQRAMVYKAAAAAARRQRREIRRAKVSSSAAASRTRRAG